MGGLFGLVLAPYLVPLAHKKHPEEPPSTVEEHESGGQASAPQKRGPLASRLTYELTQAPADKGRTPPAQQRPSGSPAKPAAATPPAVREIPEERARIANARPIYPTPPDPRDTTRAIERETQSTYRQGVRPKAEMQPGEPQPRYFEGRDLILPGRQAADTASREPRAGGSSVSSEADRLHRRASGKPVAGAPATDVESRLAATRDWLSSAAAGTHTIQLMGARDDEQLRADLNVLSRLLEPNKIYVFRTRAQGKPSVTVLYGAYPDRRTALAALDKLPAVVAANRPVLRTVKGIRAEILQQKSDS